LRVQKTPSFFSGFCYKRIATFNLQSAVVFVVVGAEISLLQSLFSHKFLFVHNKTQVLFLQFLKEFATE
jgi:hypothetical protein